jgi:hypothetical protein
MLGQSTSIISETRLHDTSKVKKYGREHVGVDQEQKI